MVLAFNKWSVDGITVEDLGLARYVTLEPRVVPRTGARYAGNKFYKSRVFILERLINKMMTTGHKSKKHFISSGHHTGKSTTVYGIVEDALSIVEKQSKINPIKVFVKALENAAQREEIVTVEYGGARYPKATECSPQRRVDQVLKYIVQGAYHKSFNKKKSIEQALADEILGAYNLSVTSMAIAKKFEIERQADSSR
ncbi:MAG TPA: 30S ribosomal protein S7 [Candidatus Nanoarchaeia archaeon]|nr:30S ribosomal protein S7 [Candidatus Nanoarchaeia archaeon]